MRPVGVRHRSDCPTLPRLSDKAANELRARLRELDEARRKAWVSSRNVFIG